MELRTAMYDGVWNAMYFLLIVGFCIGNSLYAVALWRRRGLSRVVAALYAAAAALTLQIIIVEVGGGQLVARCPRFLGLSADPAAGAHADRRVAVAASRRERRPRSGPLIRRLLSVPARRRASVRPTALDLHRQRDQDRAARRQGLEAGDVLESRDIGRRRDPVHREVRGGTIVDRGGIDSEQRDLALLDQQPRRLRAVRGKCSFVASVAWPR